MMKKIVLTVIEQHIIYLFPLHGVEKIPRCFSAVVPQTPQTSAEASAFRAQLHWHINSYSLFHTSNCILTTNIVLL